MSLSKQELVALLQEKEKRDRLRRPLFNPHPGQRKIIESQALEKFVFSGNAFGKTSLLVNSIYWAATGYNPITKETYTVPAKIYLVLSTPEKMDEVIIPELRKWYQIEDSWLAKGGKAHTTYINFPNGSKVSVLTHDVGPTKLESMELDFLFIDEPCPRYIYIALSRGGRTKGRVFRVMLCGTPLFEPWLREDIYAEWLEGKLPNVECFTGETKENENNLATGYIERFSAKLSENERDTRLKGSFFNASGAALSHLLDRTKHLVPNNMEWEPSNPCVIVFDPHTAKPHTAVLMGADRENLLYVIDEYGAKVTARRFIQQIIEQGWFKKYRIIDIIYDSAGNAESTSGEGYLSFGEVINEELKNAGIGRARGTTFEEKLDEEFIERIQDSLFIPENGAPKLRVFARCVRTWEDMKRVQFQYDRKLDSAKPVLDIRNTDWLSCVKYGLASNINYGKKKAARGYVRTDAPYGLTRKPKIIHMKRRKHL